MNLVKATAIALMAAAACVSAWLLLRQPAAAASPVIVASAAPAVPAQRLKTLGERLVETADLPTALGLLHSIFVAHQGDARDEATDVLAMWSHLHMTWPSLSAIPETRRSLVMKDPEAETGKRLCWSGSITEISADHSNGYPLYYGGIIDYNFDVLRFVAVGSSESLTEHSPARICGIVTGAVDYSNSGGGVTHAVNVVGMFDLPANRRGYAPASAPR